MKFIAIYLVVNKTQVYALADLEAGPAPTPKGPNSFVFAHVSVEKCPPSEVGTPPPQREILDPQLLWYLTSFGILEKSKQEDNVLVAQLTQNYITG